MAQALIHDPSVLILDEPTSGLDPNQVVEIRQLIKNLGKEKTVLLSTHQLTEVEAICDRAIIINHGAIVADKPTNELKSGLDKQTTIDVIFGNSIRKALIEKLPGIRSVSGEGVEFTLTAEINSKIQEALFSLAVKEGNNILSMNQRQTSLEEVFKTLTTE